MAANVPQWGNWAQTMTDVAWALGKHPFIFLSLFSTRFLFHCFIDDSLLVMTLHQHHLWLQMSHLMNNMAQTMASDI